jgi:hypothetical protein
MSSWNLDDGVSSIHIFNDVIVKTYRNCVKPPAIYDVNPESNEEVSETEARNGNKPVKLLSVEMDAALKAGHAVESASDMQFCARANGALQASNVQRATVSKGLDRRDVRRRGCDAPFWTHVFDETVRSTFILALPLRSGQLSRQRGIMSPLAVRGRSCLRATKLCSTSR